MAAWTKDDVAAEGARFHYYRGGKGKRVLVLAHGLSDNGLCWAPVAERWLDRYDVYLPDARGHGLSMRLTPGEDLEPGADLALFLKALDLHHIALGGHSMGAYSAATVAADDPELVSALILEDPGWRDPTAAVDTSRLDRLVRFQGKTADEVVAMRSQEHPTWNQEDIRASARALLQLDPTIVDTRIAFPAWNDLLPSIRCPGLLFTADPSRACIVTDKVAARVFELWPAVQVVHISGAGHSIRREQLAAYVAAVDAFLNRHYPPA